MFVWREEALDIPDQMIEIMQDIASQINKSQREPFPVTTSLTGQPNFRLGDQLQRDVRKWLSPPNPWENHDTARKSHHRGTSTWFIQSNAFKEWKSSSPNSLLWIHGKRGCLGPIPFIMKVVIQVLC